MEENVIFSLNTYHPLNFPLPTQSQQPKHDSLSPTDLFMQPLKFFKANFETVFVKQTWNKEKDGGERNSSQTHLLESLADEQNLVFLRDSVMDSSFSHLCTYVKLRRIVKCKKSSNLKKLQNFSSFDYADLQLSYPNALKAAFLFPFILTP